MKIDEKICVACGRKYALDPEEIEDRRYSPLCTECLRASCEGSLESRAEYAEASQK